MTSVFYNTLDSWGKRDTHGMRSEQSISDIIFPAVADLNKQWIKLHQTPPGMRDYISLNLIIKIYKLNSTPMWPYEPDNIIEQELVITDEKTTLTMQGFITEITEQESLFFCVMDTVNKETENELGVWIHGQYIGKTRLKVNQETL